MIDWVWEERMSICGRLLRKGKINKNSGIATPLKVLISQSEKAPMDERLSLNEFQDNKKMLREIANDGLTPKKHDFVVQKELHERIRNEDDYDDWEYGMEPITLNEF